MGDLNLALQQAKGIQLAIRVGVHTGLVVVGEMGGAGRQERLALGEVPNIASRIESREMLGVMPLPGSLPPQGPCLDTSA